MKYINLNIKIIYKKKINNTNMKNIYLIYFIFISIYVIFIHRLSINYFFYSNQ